MDNTHTPHRLLNALLDGELAPGEADRLVRTLERNPVLRQRLGELRRVRHLTRRALEDEEALARPSRRRFATGAAVAAGTLLALGFAAGWWTGATSGIRTPSAHAAVAVAPIAAEEARVILHLASANAAKMDQALDKAEEMLESYAHAGRPLRLELIVNGGGLALLRADISPTRERIDALRQRYANVAFLACRKTIEQLKLQKGIAAPLLPQVIVVPSALDQIVERLQSGWSYIRA